MFRAFGHRRSSILDGGLPNWEACGLRMGQGEVDITDKVTYQPPQLDADTIRSK